MTTRWISIHALREEGDVTEMLHHLLHRNFYPRPPRGGRLSAASAALLIRDFYPRPPRGGRRIQFTVLGEPYGISIHALREEGDLGEHQSLGRTRAISIHALREEGDFEGGGNL